MVVSLFLKGNKSYPLSIDTDLLQAGICDSLGMTELAADVEHEFPNVRIDDQDINASNFGSIGRLAAFLRTKGAA